MSGLREPPPGLPWRVAFSGTRHGMTPAQRRALAGLLAALDPRVRWADHGCCAGADEEFDFLARAGGLAVRGWPAAGVAPALCRVEALRPDTRMPARPPLTRNRLMVATAALVLAATPTVGPEPHGGTWFTARYAAANGVPGWAIDPLGVARPLADVFPAG